MSTTSGSFGSEPDDLPSAVEEDPSPVVVEADREGGALPREPDPPETIDSPAKVLRIGAMTKELLEEVRRASLDEAGRVRLREIYETSVAELSGALSDDLRAELSRLSSPFDEGVPSEGELRVAQAQLVGWLEGLFHGIQAALFSQQMAARAQMEEAHRQALPPAPVDTNLLRPGTYL